MNGITNPIECARGNDTNNGGAGIVVIIMTNMDFIAGVR